jgi:hypothetical protein
LKISLEKKQNGIEKIKDMNIRFVVPSFNVRVRTRCLISLQTSVDSTGGISTTEFQNCLANLLSSSRDPSNIVNAVLFRVSI